MSRRKPPERSWTGRSWALPKHCEPRGWPPGLSMRGCRAAWPGYREARWWSTSPVPATRCAMEWRHSIRWRHISSGNCRAWRSDRVFETDSPRESADERDPDAVRDAEEHEQWLTDNVPPHHG